MSVHAVVLAGGAGSRLWPVSTASWPKQFRTIFAEAPLISLALERAISVAGADRTWVVTEARHARVLSTLDPRVRADRIVTEPTPGGTLGAVTLAAAAIAVEDDDAVLVVLPSDHLCWTPDLLLASLSLLSSAVADGGVGLVATPARAWNPHLGYVKTGRRRGGAGEVALLDVACYLEKPATPETISDGCWLQNMGVVVAGIGMLAAVAGEGRWDAAHALVSGDAHGLVRWSELGARRIEELFAGAPTDLVVAEAPIGWADVGAWATVFESVPGDANGNRLSGAPTVVDTSRSVIVVSEGSPVTVIGMRDVLVVSSDEGVLVCHRDQVDRLQSLGRHL
jgi:mannose-1-phosphate guanylyltransferase